MNGTGGWLNWRYNRVLARNRKLRQGEPNVDESSDEEESDVIAVTHAEYAESMQKNIELMKRLPVNIENLPELRNLLNATRDYRKEMMKPKEDGMRDVDIKENFPYFLTHPETMVVFLENIILF